MLLGYIRVSTVEQNEERQVRALIEKGVDVDNLFIDKQSGKNANRAKLKEMLAFCRKGDVVITESISRIARNTKDLLDIVEQLSSKLKMKIDVERFRSVVGEWREGKTTAVEAMKKLDLKPNTFYRRVKEWGL